MLSRLTLRQRVALVAAIPLLACFLFGVQNASRMYDQYVTLDDAEQIVGISPLIGKWVYGLQRERDLSATLAAGDGEPDAYLMGELAKQKPLTDAAALALREGVEDFRFGNGSSPLFRNALLGSSSQDEYRKARVSLDESLKKISEFAGRMTELRPVATAAKTDSQAVFDAYQVPIAESYKVLHAMYLTTKDPVLTRKVMRLSALVYARNRASMERGMGAAIIARQKFGEKELVSFFRLRGQQGALFGIADWGDPTVRPVRERTDIDTDNGLSLLRRELYSKAGRLSDLSFDEVEWFKAATRRVELLDSVKNEQVMDLRGYVANEQRALRISLFIQSIFLLCFLGLVISTIRMVVASIWRALESVEAKLGAMAEGDLSSAPSDEVSKDFAALDKALDKLRDAEHARRAAEAEMQRLNELSKIARNGERDRALAEADAERSRAEKMEAEISNFERGANDLLRGLQDAADGLESAARELDEMAGVAKREASVAHGASDDAGSHVVAVSKVSDGLAESLSAIRMAINDTSTRAFEAATSARATREDARALAELSGRIDIVVSVIDDISTKTNFLALNATMAAAAAGATHNGFGVIANELKALTRQTASRAGEIGELVKSTRELSEAVSDRMSVLEGMAQTNSGGTATLAQTIAVHAEAAEEMNVAMRAAAGSSKAASGAVERVAEVASDAHDMSADLLQAASRVATTGVEFRRIYERFAQSMRAI
ncbi:nitrate- and nitrite sensing domain-containing protein [Pacificimonas sp. WHA3]|uniref:Nitrate- and nitrite sensing domain-containing protein n=1 Tax=Pacificimonas pallii TaxID=2827236 RepID=A0ABS6SDK5_9SPHN|nr:nitrate- and nitrite sensing domain-containing protein [Pacificimonas pallii]MBV7256335.1 nitrate- and nitrite sensing domain-containing protein [Pacificimonas pallii]